MRGKKAADQEAQAAEIGGISFEVEAFGVTLVTPYGPGMIRERGSELSGTKPRLPG